MRARYGVPLKITAVTAAVSAAGLAYAAGFEARSFRLRRVTIPVLPHGARPLRVLQVSDVHMVSGQRKKRAWLQSLAGLRPDFVVNTGDNLSDPEAVPELLDALGPLMEFPGVYVFGSNDYYGPKLRNPARYLFEKAAGKHGLNGNAPAVGVVHNPWEPMRDAFDDAGWLNLSNTRGRLKLDGLELAFTGLDDPHIKRDRYAEVSGGPETGADLSIGVVHAPYLRSLDAFTADGYPLILALPHPWRPALHPLLRSPGHQLRPGHGPGEGPLQPHGRRPPRLPPRLGGLRHQPLHPGPLRLPAGGDPADPHGARRVTEGARPLTTGAHAIGTKSGFRLRPPVG